MITGPDRKALRMAILEAFPAPQLRQVLAESDPSRDFDSLTSPGAHYDLQIYQLIDRADDEGWLVQLLVALLQMRVENANFSVKVAPIKERVQKAYEPEPIEQMPGAVPSVGGARARRFWSRWAPALVAAVIGGAVVFFAIQMQQRTSQVASPAVATAAADTDIYDQPMGTVIGMLAQGETAPLVACRADDWCQLAEGWVWGGDLRR